MPTQHPLLVALGREVRSRRTHHGWTIRELADGAGLSERFVADIEAGRGNVSVLRLASLAGALGVPVTTLLGAVEEARARGVIALLGLRGAGKSTIGPKLADELERPFYELDVLVEESAGLSLAEIFALHGESYYRQVEHDTLSDFLATNDGGVLATGGGIVTHPDSYDLLQATTRTVWLRAEPEDHWQRVIQQGDARPMRDNPEAMQELRQLLRTRAPLYARAHHSVDTSKLGVEGSLRELRAVL